MGATRPDRPAGRGRRLTPPAAKETAERLGIEVRQPERPSVDDLVGVDRIVLVAYGVLIPDDLLAAAQWLNVHPSLCLAGGSGARRAGDHGRAA